MPRDMLRRTGVWLLLFVLILSGFASRGDAGQPPIKAAVFDFELIDTSLQGATEGVPSDEQRRLALISDQLRRELEASGRYEVVDLAPVHDQIQAVGYLHGCKGCVARIGRSVGAEVAFAGTVQKVSNLILNINLQLWDTATGKPLQAMSADLRGNTDESWSRGVSYLLRNRLLKQSVPE